jgi:hypothetical protein
MSLLDQLAGATNPTPAQKREARKILHEGYEVDVIPYNANYDPNAANFLPWLWAKLKEDGLIRLYFPRRGRDRLRDVHSHDVWGSKHSPRRDAEC